MKPIENPIVEVCTENLDSVIAAAQGGAERIELCSHLELDGLTPSDDMIHKARDIAGLILHVLIRPRKGNFIYSTAEIEQMAASIDTARELGADGVVFGALLPSGDIDKTVCKELLQHAVGMNTTFHRAFDVCRQPFSALEEIIELGFNRILTSGQAATAEEGIPLLRQLVARADNRIVILPGAGVNANNAERILHETGAREIHGSFRTNGISNPEIIKKVKQSNIYAYV